ncbi:MAG: tRNA uridine-5-carboxymethylaminomethyl(34) synthesis GTPase MnmE [Candidatus Atribacteria bacterium]|nr:tRNA uridine-5-carboxymethylaminomethyl(34) synthesis GTPase MnmE [Candidatus Atribacteria bacterium]MBE3127202.1 tRNA uridine-5-carboxymethylaminomethyl(34) synthesis GTPase MnmE [Candidatus Atribacteria bacterium]
MKFWENDTIAAISTPIGESGIGIVRISGPKTLEIAQEVFRDKNLNRIKIKDFFSHTVHYGFIIDPESGEKIDEVILILMKKPQTYTREDTVEFNCHGGILSLRKALETMINCGARMAEPGEFTKRAFLNGRIDLSQAEAVIDLIQAKTERSLSSSLAQLGGNLNKKITDLMHSLIRISAEVEAPMDFPDQDIEEKSPKKVEESINYILKEINFLIETLDYGKILKEGINTLIIGKVNVGKSSLFNTLLRENRAIVTHLPGTTRDTIEELINIKGTAFKIIDTAGLKNPENIIEKISIKKMMKHLKEARLILVMFDASVPLSLEDKEVIKEINKEKNENKKVIVIENKIDLSKKIDREKLLSLLDVKDSIKMSLKEKIGIEELEEKLARTAIEGLVIPENGVVINNVRQANQLNRAKQALEHVLLGLKGKITYDFLTIDLKDALDSLGEITGDSINDEMVNDIFSRFCIGK